MASSYSNRQRNAPPVVVIKPFTRAAQNFALQTKLTREILDGNGQSMGTEVYTEVRIQGTVLAIGPGFETDIHGRNYKGLNIQINPDKDRFVQTADPEVQKTMDTLHVGDLVYVTGEWHRNAGSRGFHTRLRSILVLERAIQPGPVVSEQAIASTLASIEAEDPTLAAAA